MRNYDIAAYIWPAYTGDEMRARQFWDEGIGEWQTVKNPTKKPEWNFKNPQPIWGYVNEANKDVMEMQINTAADHGVNVFIYDWYWYDERPFLEQCLNEGYLKAKNNDRVKFYLMWANHNATCLWDKRISDMAIDTTVWKGTVSQDQFDIITDRLIEKYFTQPSYYKINGAPVFMIYDVNNLVLSLGGSDNAKIKLNEFREKVKAAGFPDLELQLCGWSERTINLSGVDGTRTGSTKDIAKILNFNSITNYQFAHLTDVNRDYLEVFEDIKKEWARIDRDYEIPYYPHISVGWDNNLRFNGFSRNIMKNNTPGNFEIALKAAKEYIDTHPGRAPLITINSWNEWTEGSYLEPDTVNGYAYLEAVKRVFKD